MPGLLIVEDSGEVQILLKRALADISGELTIVGSAADARSRLASDDFQLILLDISLPDGDGLQFCAELQANERTRGIPVMFLTGQKDVAHKVTAFTLGAEDYIEKPFNALELRARVGARLKKSTQQGEGKQVIVKGKLKLDAASQRAWDISIPNEGKVIHLTPREFSLLFHLAKNEERILTRTQLMDAVWGNSAEVFDRAVDVHISAIRKKLARLGSYIEAVTGVGYRFSSLHKTIENESKSA